MLTNDQIAHFYTLGFVRVAGALTPEEVDQFSWRFDALMEQDAAQEDSSAAGARIFPGGHRVIIPLIEADPHFYNLLDHPNLAGIAEDLLGEDCIYYGSSDGQIHDGDTNWHRDGGLPEPAIEIKLTFYLDDVSPGQGCLSFIPGSHFWPLEVVGLQKKADESAFGYPMPELPGRYDLPTEKGDVIALNTRIWHSSWGGGANRRQMAWIMRTRPRQDWEFEHIVNFNKQYAERWSPETGRLVTNRLFETASPRRMKKIRVLKDLGL